MRSPMVGAAALAVALASGLACSRAPSKISLPEPFASRQHLVAFTPDGRLVAVRARASGSMTSVGAGSVYEPATGRLVAQFEMPADREELSPDGRLIAVLVQATKTVEVLDLTGMRLLHVELPRAPVRSAFAPDGSLLAVVDGGGVTVWDTRSWSVAARLPGGGSGSVANGLRWSADGRRLAVWGRALRTYDLASGEVREGPARQDSRWLADMAPDGLAAASVSEKGVWLESLSGERLVAGAQGSAAFSPDGTLLVAAAAGGGVGLWDRATGAMRSSLAGGCSAPSSYAFSPDARLLAVASDNGEVRVHDIAARRQLLVLDEHECEPNENLPGRQIAFSPDGRRLVVASRFDHQSGEIEVHTLTGEVAPRGGVVRAAAARPPAIVAPAAVPSAAGPVLMSFEGGRSHGERHITSGTWSPDGRRIALGLADGTVRLLDPATADTHATWKLHRGLVRAVAWGRHLATAGDDGAVQVVEASTGQKIRTLQAGAKVSALAMSSDGTLVATASEDDVVRLWEGRDGRLLHRRPVARAFVASLAFAPDGRTLWSVYDDALKDSHSPLERWSLANPSAPAIRSVGEVPQARVLAVTRSGRRLAVGSTGGVSLREGTTGAEQRWIPLADPVRAVAFTPDAGTLAVLVQAENSRPRAIWEHTIPEGTIYLLDAETGASRGRLAPAHARNCVGGALAFAPDGRRLLAVHDCGFDGGARVYDTAAAQR